MFKEKIAALKKQIAEKKAAAKAFVKLAEEEDRDLTEEESAQIDKITDEEIPKLKADLARQEKLLAYSEEEDHSGEDSGASTGDEPLQVTVPAQARRHGKLQAFRGENAEVDAYTAGRWLMATIGQDDDSREWCQEHGVDVRHHGAMTTTDNKLGGFTVPNEMEVSIIALREKYGVFRQNAHVEPMSSDVKTITRPTGGIEAHFVGEREAADESDSNWKNVELVCRKLMALTRMSKELSADSVVSIADQVARDIAYAFAKKEDKCGFLGDGTSTYGGVTGLKNALRASSKYTATAGNLSFATLDLADFETMLGMIPEYAEDNCKWYITKKGYYASMARLLDAAGGNTNENLTEGNKLRFLGHDVEIIPSEAGNTTLSNQADTDGLLYLGDMMMAATLASRAGMAIESSKEVYFTTDEIAIKGTQRFGINIHERGSETASDLAGPIIMLSTPGA